MQIELLDVDESIAGALELAEQPDALIDWNFRNWTDQRRQMESSGETFRRVEIPATASARKTQALASVQRR